MGLRATPLILASASPRRKALMKLLGRPFKVLPSHTSEDSETKNPRLLVQELALRKARATAKTLTDGLVIGADTLVVLKGKVLGKPNDAAHAYQMLYRLSGSTHSVMTGVAIVDVKSDRQEVSCEVSTVKMKKIDLDVLLTLSRKHLDKAGSYAIQEKRDPIATVVKGSYDNVVGLPMTLVKTLLKKISTPR